MTQDGRSTIRRLFLLESVYKGGRRLAMVLAKHPFEAVLQIRLIEFAQDATDKLAIRVEECGRRNRFAELKLLHLIRSSAHQQRKRNLVLLGKWLNQQLTLLVINRGAEHDHTFLLILLLHLCQQRHLVLALNAPRRPEIQDYDLPPVPADILSVPLCIAQ